MRRNDFFDIEEQIRKAVDSASDYIDYDRIKDTINFEAGNILDEVKRQLKRSTDFVQKAADTVEQGVKSSINMYNKSSKYKYIAKNPKGKIKGVVYSILGTTMGVLGIYPYYNFFCFVSRFSWSRRCL